MPLIAYPTIGRFAPNRFGSNRFTANRFGPNRFAPIDLKAPAKVWDIVIDEAVPVVDWPECDGYDCAQHGAVLHCAALCCT